MSRVKTRYVSATLIVGAFLAGCPRPPEETQAAKSGEANTDSRRERSVVVAQALGGRLKAQLQAAGDGDLAAKIGVCQVAAPEIAHAVGAEERVRVGRTSHKLRNPANQPPDWAAAWVAERREEPAFAEGPDGSLRALLPIRLEAMCVSCHGPAESLSPEVRAALAERYPEDQATGFQVGDLRGWFWVEIPPED
jgi:Protein of unknown function (DUF3365)